MSVCVYYTHMYSIETNSSLHAFANVDYERSTLVPVSLTINHHPQVFAINCPPTAKAAVTRLSRLFSEAGSIPASDASEPCASLGIVDSTKAPDDYLQRGLLESESKQRHMKSPGLHDGSFTIHMCQAYSRPWLDWV